MPLYEYRCQQCGETFERLRRMSEADSPTECPRCRSERVQRQMSTFAAGGCGAAPGSRFR